MFKFSLALLLSLAAAPVLASPAALAGCCHEAIAIDPAPVDPARLVVAQSLAELIWPNGTYELASEIGDEVGVYRQETVAGLAESTLVSLAQAASFEGSYDNLLETLGKKDLDLEKRRAIATRLAELEVRRQLARADERARLAIAKYFARRFTVPQLTDILTFARTPNGASFVGQIIPMTENDGTEREIRSADPSILMGSREFEAAVRAATAHLAPIPKSQSDDKSGSSVKK